jgi:hypothetical protein
VSAQPRAHDVTGRPIGLEAVWRDAPLAMAVIDTELRFVTINERLAENTAAIARRQLHCRHRLVDDLPDVSRITHDHIELLVETVTAASALAAAVDGACYPARPDRARSGTVGRAPPTRSGTPLSMRTIRITIVAPRPAGVPPMPTALALPLRPRSYRPGGPVDVRRARAAARPH